MLARDYWSPQDCVECFVDSETPHCKKTGECICLENIKAKSQNLCGTPPNYLNASGLCDVLTSFEQITSLSPFSESGCPTLQALGWVEWESPISQIDFLELLNVFHSHQVNAWVAARKSRDHS